MLACQDGAARRAAAWRVAKGVRETNALARNAVVGDAIARLLDATGSSVTREYYFNDGGLQMEVLADSLRARYLQQLGREAELPAGGYEGAYLVEIARALTTEPRFVLLDEPFTGIDPIAIADIQKIVGTLKERGIGVLITDHNVRETLQITDRAYIIRSGKIFRAGTPDELGRDPETREIYLGQNFRLD